MYNLTAGVRFQLLAAHYVSQSTQPENNLWPHNLPAVRCAANLLRTPPRGFARRMNRSAVVTVGERP
jgi:hypothetical protein